MQRYNLMPQHVLALRHVGDANEPAGAVAPQHVAAPGAAELDALGVRGVDPAELVDLVPAEGGGFGGGAGGGAFCDVGEDGALVGERPLVPLEFEEVARGDRDADWGCGCVEVAGGGGGVEVRGGHEDVADGGGGPGGEGGLRVAGVEAGVDGSGGGGDGCDAAVGGGGREEGGEEGEEGDEVCGAHGARVDVCMLPGWWVVGRYVCRMIELVKGVDPGIVRIEIV